MSLREEMWKYEQITGESAEHVPIIKLGAFLDGYEMGLKALEQQPCEDAISRKRLIILIDEGGELHPYKVVGDSETYSDYNQGWTDAFDWLYANIDCDNLPSVKPQQEQGEWIDTRFKDEWYGTMYICSKCNGEMMGTSDFCPNCGAKMDKEIKNDKSRSK